MSIYIFVLNISKNVIKCFIIFSHGPKVLDGRNFSQFIFSMSNIYNISSVFLQYSIHLQSQALCFVQGRFSTTRSAASVYRLLRSTWAVGAIVRVDGDGAAGDDDVASVRRRVGDGSIQHGNIFFRAKV